MPTIRNFALIAALAGGCKESAKRAPEPAPSTQPAPSQPEPPAMTPPVPSAPVDASKPATDLARASNHFALALWPHAGAGNVALSPASIATALTITWGGAKGDTAAQMQKVLGLEGPPDILLSRWGNLYKSLKSDTLKMANRLYGEKTFSIDTTYFTIVRKAFDVWIEPIDFNADPDGSRTKINTWVADETAQRIKDLLPPGAIDALTKLVIVNAVYFLADWAHPFEVSRTQPQDFFVGGTAARPVPTMSQTSSFSYANAAGASLVELPYKDKRTSMYLLVPDARDGLPALETTLESTFKTLQSKLAERRLALSLPRFTIDPPSSIDLAKVLQKLGMVDAFSAEKADFSNIAKPKTPADKIFISAVFHKAFVKVDEKGTEAAAATAVAMPRGGPPPGKVTELHVDHPFLFVIADKPSGLILFIGRVVDPA
jgi:serpin B